MPGLCLHFLPHFSIPLGHHLSNFHHVQVGHLGDLLVLFYFLHLVGEQDIQLGAIVFPSALLLGFPHFLLLLLFDNLPLHFITTTVLFMKFMVVFSPRLLLTFIMDAFVPFLSPPTVILFM